MLKFCHLIIRTLTQNYSMNQHHHYQFAQKCLDETRGLLKIIPLHLDEKYSVICNKVQYDAKTQTQLPLWTMDLKKHRDDLHEVEKTFIEFAKIHKEKENNYADVGERILLLLNKVSTFFAADVAYHAKCYHTFRSPSWKKEFKNQSKNLKD